MEGEIRTEILAFELELGLGSGFFEALLEQDDWSFVIKLHALLEAAVSHLLAEVLGRPELIELFGYVELGNKKMGKIAFAKVLGCVTENDRRFITCVSELRNRIVHDVRNASFSLDRHVASLDGNQMRTMVHDVYAAAIARHGPEHVVRVTQLLRSHPKACLWHRAMLTIAKAYNQKRVAALFHETNRLLRMGIGVDDGDDE